ncbi:MAG: tetratricopeptide repeat protein [Candidatus Eisenbacteria bacterium]|nr:tetratricopeptide repeat protein [Candidatus Eisenbacteria bacterium]
MAFARSGVLLKSGASPEAIHSALEAVVDGYPKSGVAPRALLALAANADQRDRPEEAFEYLDRIGEEYPKDEEFLSQALIYRARLLDARGRWPEALETYRTLTSQHPLSEAALTAPLEIAQREARAGDEAAARTALDAARRAYLDFIDRYPPSRYTILARTNLARTLALLKDYESAVTEMVRLGEDLAGTTEGAAWFASAAKMARDELADRERAAEILDRMAKAHEGADPGKWATREAQKLREPPTP